MADVSQTTIISTDEEAWSCIGLTQKSIKHSAPGTVSGFYAEAIGQK